jgi:hypothetical protein
MSRIVIVMVIYHRHKPIDFVVVSIRLVFTRNLCTHSSSVPSVVYALPIAY